MKVHLIRVEDSSERVLHSFSLEKEEVEIINKFLDEVQSRGLVLYHMRWNAKKYPNAQTEVMIKSAKLALAIQILRHDQELQENCHLCSEYFNWLNWISSQIKDCGWIDYAVKVETLLAKMIQEAYFAEPNIF